MTMVHLGFKAFDLHELACHLIARQAGLYATQGLDVRLLDTTFIADELLPPRTFGAACGAALFAWLRGAPLRVVFVACDRPMFWLVARSGTPGPGIGTCSRIAGYPPGTPPAEFLRLILEASADAAHRQAAILPARDDVARLGLLLAGDADAAVLSSAVPPARLALRGLDSRCFFGDVLRLPSTGLAVHRDLPAQEPELVSSMVACYRESLRLLHADAALAGEAFAACLDLSREEAREAVELVRGCFTMDGQSTAAVRASAIDSLRLALGVSALPSVPLYEPVREA